MWNTRANGDAIKENYFDTLERDVRILKVEWISANRIATGMAYSLIEIWEIDEKGKTTNNRVIQQIKYGDEYVSLRIRRYSIVLPLFVFHLLKGWITGLKWNETTKYLASCSLDTWIEV